MYKILNVKTKSITEVKHSFSNLIKEANSTREPIYILSDDRLTTVILDNNVYETIIKERQMLEEKLFYYQVNSRVAKIPGRLIPSNEVKREINHIILLLTCQIMSYFTNGKDIFFGKRQARIIRSLME